jgi:hypothetical protein
MPPWFKPNAPPLKLEEVIPLREILKQKSQNDMKHADMMNEKILNKKEKFHQYT